MRRKKIISLCLSTVLAFTMCLAGVQPAFAGTEEGLAVENQISAAGIERNADPGLKKGSIQARGDIPELPLNQKIDDLTAGQFTLSIPSAGKLTIGMVSYDAGHQYDWTVQAKTNGFSDYVYFTDRIDYTRVIGVKKGTYTFTVKPVGDQYTVITKFTPVKESKYGKKKSKAVKIKKNKTQKGLMITGAQKTHWYKIKNTKTHKVKLIFKTVLMDTGKLGGIKVTFYKGKRSFGSRIIYTDDTNEIKTTLKPYNTLGMKLKKGTYTVKVEPYHKASGTFTLKWK